MGPDGVCHRENQPLGVAAKENWGTMKEMGEMWSPPVVDPILRGVPGPMGLRRK